jgi:hypothetical protein
MQITLEIDDKLAEALLRAQGIGPAELAEAETSPPEAVELVLTAAVSVLAGSPDEATAGLIIDQDALRDELLRIAGAQRPIDLDLSPSERGQPIKVWTPDTKWQPLEGAPARYFELEDHVASIFEMLAVQPELRTLVSRRRGLTDEPIMEGVFAEVHDPFEFRTVMGGGLYRIRIAPTGALVIGSLEGQPSAVRGGR